jgi:hypothetical protein
LNSRVCHRQWAAYGGVDCSIRQIVDANRAPGHRPVNVIGVDQRTKLHLCETVPKFSKVGWVSRPVAVALSRFFCQVA